MERGDVVGAESGHEVEVEVELGDIDFQEYSEAEGKEELVGSNHSRMGEFDKGKEASEREGGKEGREKGGMDYKKVWAAIDYETAYQI